MVEKHTLHSGGHNKIAGLTMDNQKRNRINDLKTQVARYQGELEKLHGEIAMLEGEVQQAKGTRPATPEERQKLREIADPVRRLEMARQMGLE